MRLAIFFPGIGYKFDRPLLKELIDALKEKDFEIVTVDYSGFTKNSKYNLSGDVEIALKQSENILDGIDWDAYEEVLFVGKSIGSAVASLYAYEKKIKCKKILLTPIPNTFVRPIENAIAFAGTNDTWITKEQIVFGCKVNFIELSLYNCMNHSLVCSDENMNRKVLQDVLQKSLSFIG